MRHPWRALQRNETPEERRRAALRAHEHFLAGEATPAEMRGVVLDSWLRSATATLNPDLAPRAGLSADDLAAARSGHPLTRVLPVIHRLLTE